MDTQNISNIRQLLNLHTGLRPEDVQRIQNGTFEDIHDALYEIQKRLPKNIYLDIDNLTTDAQKLYPGVPLDGKEQFEAEQRQPDIPDWGDAAILASAPLAFLRTSKESELTYAYDVEKKEDVNKEIKDILAIKDTDTKEKKVRALLESLQREELYKDRKTKLIEQLKDSRHGEELIKRVENRYSELEKERQKPIDRGSSLQDRASTPTASNTAYTAYLDRLMKITLSNMSNDQLEKFLKEYANKQLHGTHIDFQKLFSEERKRFKFLGDKQLISKRTQNTLWRKQKGKTNEILNNWDAERKKKEKNTKTQRDKEKAEEQAKLSLLSRFLNLRRLVFSRDVAVTIGETTESSSENSSGSSGFPLIDTLNNLYDSFKNGGSLKRLRDKFGSDHAPEGLYGGQASIGEGGQGLVAFFSSPPGWVVIGIIILLIIILIVIALMGDDGQPIYGVLQENCGDFSKQIDVDHLPDDYANLQNDIFHIKDYGANYKETVGDVHFQQALSSYQFVFDTLCILYGHTTGGLTGSDQYNTFAKLLLGDRLVSKNGTLIYVDDKKAADLGLHPKAKFIRQYIVFDDSNKKCYAQFHPHASQGTEIMTEFVNPQLCNPYQFQYLIAQSLAHAIIIQQDVVSGRQNSVFQTYLTANPASQDGSLPTTSCQGIPSFVYGSIVGEVTPGTNVGENESDQQDRNCFADMIGTYLTYAFYYDQPPATATSTKPTATPTGSTASSPVTDFPTGKYKDYYNFAKANIFDNVDFFSSSHVVTCPSIPTTDDAVVSGLKSWGFTISSEDGVKLTPTIDTNIYQIVCQDYQATTFKNLIKADPTISGSIPVSIVFSISKCSGAGVTADPTIYLCMGEKTDATVIDPSFDHLQFYLNHELGHIVQHRNPSINTDWENIFSTQNLSKNMLYTINCGLYKLAGGAADQASECLSDAIALYTTYGNFTNGSFGGFGADPLSNYLSYNTSPHMAPYFDFVNTQVFGNTVFFSSGNAAESAVAQYATKLAQTIIQNCPTLDTSRTSTFILGKDAKCLQSALSNNYQPNVIQDLVDGIVPIKYNSPSYLQCVAFVRAVADGINHPLTKPTDEGKAANNADDYAGTTQPGYTWYSQAVLKNSRKGVAVGDIAVFGGAFIHIAIVTSVTGDGTHIFGVAEANGGSGSVDITSPSAYHADDGNFMGVFRLN